MTYIAIADDHFPGIEKIVSYLNKRNKTTLLFKSINGYQLILDIQNSKTIPEIVIIDINMPYMDGIATSYFLSIHYPKIQLIALSVYTDVHIIKQTFECGVMAYIYKANAELILEDAILNLASGNIFIDNRLGVITNDFQNISLMKTQKSNAFNSLFTPRELTFLILNATALTYQDIAKIMYVETKTVHTYFDRISKKLGISSRQALTLFSIQNRLAKIALYPYSN